MSCSLQTLQEVLDAKQKKQKGNDGGNSGSKSTILNPFQVWKGLARR